MKKYILGFLIFLFPLFFLPFTQEFFITNKLYLLVFSALFLLLISNIQYLISKKLSWKSLPFDTPLILFLIVISLSTLVSSTNKIQAILNPNFGLISILSLTILYFYLSRLPSSITQLLNYSITFSSFLLSLITIIFFFQPFKNVNLPTNLQFLKNPSFTPIGNQLDLAIFLGFFVVLALSQIFEKQLFTNKKFTIYYLLFTILNLTALSLTFYSLFQPISTSFNKFQPILTNLPPFRLSWYAAVEVLKNPLTALFGVGPDNFSTIFTKIKDLAYNQSSLWQISSFVVSRSTLLHIFTETGIFGLLSFSLILIQLIKIALSNKQKSLTQLLAISYLLLVILFLPPSLPLFFLLFLTLSIISSNNESRITDNKNKFLDLSQFLPIYLGIAIIWFLFIGGTSYFLARSYAAEYYFKKSLDGINKNNLKEIYDNLKKARILNQFEEKYVLNFSQINLLIAENLARKNKDKITDQDKQIITQAIQTAINEGKTLINLNPNKATYYENLANVYKNIVGLAQGASSWAISLYQRAIILDPVNPFYRFNLGGIYYFLGQYNDASKAFEQTVFLKPDWANANYNLAWAYFQNKEYDKATKTMQNVINLIDKKTNPQDFKKAEKELEDFKNRLIEEEKISTTEGNLTLPKPPETKLEPKLKLQ